MFKNIFLVLYLFVLLNKVDVIKGSDDVKEEFDKSKDVEPILFHSCGNRLEHELEEAIQDNMNRLKLLTLNDHNEQQLTDLTGGLLEKELEDASKEDARVPSSLENSLFNENLENNFEHLRLSMNSMVNNKREPNVLHLKRVSVGHVPVGIIEQDYSFVDNIKLNRLYQSNRNDDRIELFQYLAEHIHNRYKNCVSNLGKWIRNLNPNEPIFYRNCVPCANAVDLNLESLLNHQLHSEKLKHYFVNTCDMETQWISYITDMEYLPVDLKNSPSTTFTDVIRQNLIPNYRYVIQGLVKSDRAINPRDFLHVCNLISDENGQLWVIDGQIEKVFQLNQLEHVNELNKRYRPDYVARAATGLFRPPSLIRRLRH